MWKLEGDGTPIQPCLEFSPDGRWLVTIAAMKDTDGELRVWSLVPSPEVYELASSDVPQPGFRWFTFHPQTGHLVALRPSFAPTPAGEMLVQERELISWGSDLQGSPRQGPKLPPSAAHFIFDPYGSELLAEWADGWGGSHAGMLRIRWPSGEILSPWRYLYLNPRFTADGQYVVLFWDSSGVVLDTRPVTGPTRVGGYFLINTITATMHPSEPWILDVADNQVRLREIPSGELIGECGLLDTPVVTRTAFSPDGRRIALAHSRNVVPIVDAESWSLVDSYHWDIGSISALTFAPDGLRCAVAGDSGSIIVWDVE